MVCGGGPPRSEAGIPAVRDVRVRGCVNDGGRCSEWGEAGLSESAWRGIGDPDSDPALKGWKDTDGLLPDSPSPLIVGLDAGPLDIGNELGGTISFRGNEAGGELVLDPGAFTDLRAVKGLVPNGPSPWKVDKLP